MGCGANSKPSQVNEHGQSKPASDKNRIKETPTKQAHEDHTKDVKVNQTTETFSAAVGQNDTKPAEDENTNKDNVNKADGDDKGASDGAPFNDTKVTDTDAANGSSPDTKQAQAPTATQAQAQDQAQAPVAKPGKKDNAEFTQEVQDSNTKLLEEMAAEDTLRASMGVFYGDFNTKIINTKNIVRIFTSGTFTDTFHERNTLMQHGYRELKAYCRSLGYEFQVVDMRWGVRDEATDDHMGSELCFKELILCQTLSTGPNFVSLLSHKYGYTPNPRLIVEDHFEKMMKASEDTHVVELFNKWYSKDENHVPTSYKLAPISSLIPDFLSIDTDKRKDARGQWRDESSAMMDAINQIAPSVIGEEVARQYTMSITEAEVERGLLQNPAEESRCLWLKRNITDIHQQESSYALSRFIECQGPEEKWKTARELLRQLKEDKMAKVLGKDRILEYNINWCPETGVEPEKSQEHREYLQTVNKEFVIKMKGMIDAAVTKSSKEKHTLATEIRQHLQFCKDKCQSFCGRKDTLNRIKAYIQSDEKEILVIHGKSGSGKTSLLAKAAMMAKEWLSDKKKTIVVLRFIGTTPVSSSITSLLRSVVSQIFKALELKLPELETYTKCEITFLSIVKSKKIKSPVIIMLDSLDQLSPSNDARQLQWLISSTKSTNIKVIVSTLPEDTYDCFPALKGKLKNEDRYIGVPVLQETDTQDIVQKWLDTKQRRLTPAQLQLVLDNFKHSPTPLFLKLSFDEASRWTSFASEKETILQTSVRATIDAFFQRLEIMHGQALVSKSLAYITAAHSGLTETELEDMLSCDDDVLNDVYAYWTPPVRRLPPLLLVRLKTDLEEYLVEQGKDDVTIIYWYHRQFIEAAKHRYCSDPTTLETLHGALADFFAGTWANGNKKPYTTKTGEQVKEDRQIQDQPFLLGESIYNLRKINNLPYHRVQAGQLQQLKEECLCNIDFLIAKLKAVDIRSVLADYDLALEKFPDDSLLADILRTLTLSQGALTYDPKQLASQIVNRMDKNKTTEAFLERCRLFPHTYLDPCSAILTKPGGQLIHCISAHIGEVDYMDMSSDGRMVVTVSSVEKAVRVWDVPDGKLRREFTRLDRCDKALFCDDDKNVVIGYKAEVAVKNIETGNTLRTNPLKKGSIMHVAGPNNTVLFILKGRSVAILDINNIEKKEVITRHEVFKIGRRSIIAGCTTKVVVSDRGRYTLTGFDIEKKCFFPKFTAFDHDYFRTELVKDIKFLPDEKTVVYFGTRDMCFADVTTGDILNTIKGKLDWSFNLFGFVGNGSQLYISDKDCAKHLDFEKKHVENELKHPVSISCIRSHDFRHVITVAADSNLRIWDRSRPSQEKTEETGDFHEFTFIRTLNQAKNCRYVRGRGKDFQSQNTCMLYDVIEKKIVRQVKLSKDIGRVVAEYSERDMIFCKDDKVLRSFSLETRQQVVRYQCNIVENRPVILKTRNSLLVQSRGRMNVLELDIDSGKIVQVFKSGLQRNDDRISELLVNEKETILACKTDEGPLQLFDVHTNKLLRTIYHKEDVKTDDTMIGFIWGLSPSGSHFLFSIDDVLPGMDAKAMSVTYMVTWGTKEDKIVARLFDLEYTKSYAAMNMDKTTGVDEIVVVDDKIALLASDDYVIRVHNYLDGTLIMRLTGHTTLIKMSYVEKGPYFVTLGSFTEENSIRLWDKQTYECVASFTSDKEIGEITLSGDGKYIYGYTKRPTAIVVWFVQHGSDYMVIDPTSYPVTYRLEENDTVLSVDIDEVTDFGPDLDDDVFEPEDSDDDDDDDDDNGDEGDTDDDKEDEDD